MTGGGDQTEHLRESLGLTPAMYQGEVASFGHTAGSFRADNRGGQGRPWNLWEG